MKQYISYGYILLAGILWGLIGLFNRHLAAEGLAPASIVLLRNVGGFLVLGLVFLLFDRSVFRVQPRHLPLFFGTGVISVLLFTLCYFTCQQHASLAVAAILLYTSPTFVVVLSAVLWRDKITKNKAAALVITFLGCSFVSGVWNGGTEMTLSGFLLGIGSGFFYALYSIFGRYALAHYPPFTVTLYTFLFAGAGALAVCPVRETIQALTSPLLCLLGVGLVLVSTVLPYLLYTKGLAEVDSGKAAILASVEPVTAALVGVAAFGEPMTPMVLAGLGCVVMSIYILR